MVLSNHRHVVFALMKLLFQGLRELLGISRKHQSIPAAALKKPPCNVDQGVQTEANQPVNEVNLEVTMPAPPPRANRAAAAKAEKPVSPDGRDSGARIF